MRQGPATVIQPPGFKSPAAIAAKERGRYLRLLA